MEEFYGLPMGEELMLDRFKYRGKGRPRKIDYSKMAEIQKKYNQALNWFIDRRKSLEKGKE